MKQKLEDVGYVLLHKHDIFRAEENLMIFCSFCICFDRPDFRICRMGNSSN